MGAVQISKYPKKNYSTSNNTSLMDSLNIFGSLSFKNLVKNPEFRQFLRALGGVSIHSDVENIVPSYWTSTRWRIEKIKGKDYVLSPAFYRDEDLSIRFAIRVDKDKFQLNVHVKKKNEEKILDSIACYKIVTEYMEDEKKNTYRVELTPFEELFVTISNLDAYFQEKLPIYETWDLNIVNQAFDIVIERGYATQEIRKKKCKEITENIILLSEDEDLYKAQIYIQIKSLLDFWDFDWFNDLNEHVDLLGFLHEIAAKESSEEIEHKIAFIAERRTDERLLDKFITEMTTMNLNAKNRVYWFVSCIKRQSIRRRLESILLRRLERENETNSKNIIELLLKIGHVENKLLLFEKFSRLDLTTKIFILENLESNLDLRHVPFLMQLLEDRNWQVRQKTIEILALIGDIKVVEPIIIHLDDSHFLVRSQAASLLGQFKSKIALKPLILRLRKEENINVQMSILDSIEEIKEKSASFPLIETFRNKQFEDKVQTRIIEVLARIGGSKVEEFLKELMTPKTTKHLLLAALEAAKLLNEQEIIKSVYQNLTHPEPSVRMKALETIRFFPTPSEPEIIFARLKDERSVQLEAIRTIGHLQIKNGYFHLAQLLKSTDDEIVRETILSLGRIKDERGISSLLNISDIRFRNHVALALPKLIKHPTISALMKRLINPDWKVRLSVVRTIGEFKNRESIPALIFSIQDKNENVRSEARKFLSEYEKLKIEMN
ncbi:MAG: HEAT repeat domain-containing protein [Candidatus Helarchaeota archaeon]